MDTGATKMNDTELQHLIWSVRHSITAINKKLTIALKADRYKMSEHEEKAIESLKARKHNYFQLLEKLKQQKENNE